MPTKPPLSENKRASISIVIPVYNEAAMIGPCLDAIAKQTHTPKEVIVVDNNCTDETIEIAKRYSFVEVLKEPIQGLVFARNKGFNAATASILSRIDADTVVDEDWCQSIVNYFNEHVDKMAVSGPVSFREVKMRAVYSVAHKVLFYWSSMVLLGHRTMFGSNMAIRAVAWNARRHHVCLRDDIHEDMDLSVHVNRLYRGSIGFDKKVRASISVRRVRNMGHYPKMWLMSKLVHL